MVEGGKITDCGLYSLRGLSTDNFHDAFALKIEYSISLLKSVKIKYYLIHLISVLTCAQVILSKHLSHLL